MITTMIAMIQIFSIVRTLYMMRAKKTLFLDTRTVSNDNQGHAKCGKNEHSTNNIIMDGYCITEVARYAQAIDQINLMCVNMESKIALAPLFLAISRARAFLCTENLHKNWRAIYDLASAPLARIFCEQWKSDLQWNWIATSLYDAAYRGDVDMIRAIAPYAGRAASNSARLLCESYYGGVVRTQFSNKHISSSFAPQHSELKQLRSKWHGDENVDFVTRNFCEILQAYPHYSRMFARASARNEQIAKLIGEYWIQDVFAQFTSELNPHTIPWDAFLSGICARGNIRALIYILEYIRAQVPTEFAHYIFSSYLNACRAGNADILRAISQYAKQYPHSMGRLRSKRGILLDAACSSNNTDLVRELYMGRIPFVSTISDKIYAACFRANHTHAIILSAFYAACRAGNVGAMRFLLAKNKHLITTSTQWISVLSSAIPFDRAESAQVLFDLYLQPTCPFARIRIPLANSLLATFTYNSPAIATIILAHLSEDGQAREDIFKECARCAIHARNEHMLKLIG
jgi:hypothetical protein